MTPASRALGLLAALLLEPLLAPTESRADTPACVELVLPEALPQRDSWRSLLQQETKPVATAERGDCAQVALRLEPGAREPSALLVSWDTQLRSVPLALADVPLAQRPRAAALLARGALQQLVQASDSAARERAASELDAAGGPLGTSRSARDVPSSGRTSASTRESARAERGGKSTPAPRKDAPPALVKTPTPTAVRATPPPLSAPLAAPRIDVDLVDDARERSQKRREQWSGIALAGSTVIVNKLTPLIRLELGVLRRIDALHARVGLGVLGIITQTRALQLGGPGLRAGVEFELARSSLVRVWLGPGGSVSELVLARTSDTGRFQRSVHTVASVDARLNVELVMSRRSQLLLALEGAYAVRYLEVRRGDNRMLAYAGPMVGLHVGAGF